MFTNSLLIFLNTATMPQELISVNPANGQMLKKYPVYSEKKVDSLLKNAVKQQKEWTTTTFKQRAIVLKQIAKQIRTDIESLATMASREMGKPFSQSMAELEKSATTFEYYAKHGAAYLQDEQVLTEAKQSFVSYRPMGVVLAIMPWNFPYWQVFRAMAPAVMAGNVLVLKHASNVTGCALAIEKVIQKSGAPKGLLQTLCLPSSQMDAIIARPEIAAVTLTGSTQAGKHVASVAGKYIKKLVLELGGSDPYLLLKDADLDMAVPICVNGRLVNSGQSCVAAKRFVVDRTIRKDFEERMRIQMMEATYGDPFNPEHKIGPLARHDLRDQLHAQVTSSIEKGAKLLCGGFIPENPGAFYPPTVLTNVRKGMPAYDEELFGPVAAIIEAKDEEDAIRIANDSSFGLGSGIFSRNRKRATEIATKRIEAGNCFVNAFVHSDPRLPFGGIKESGYGRELGIMGIREFTYAKTVFVQ